MPVPTALILRVPARTAGRGVVFVVPDPRAMPGAGTGTTEVRRMHTNITVPNGWALDESEPVASGEARHNAAAEAEIAAIQRIVGELGQRERALALVLLQAIAAWHSMQTPRAA
jgi:hypothetical protein